MIILYFHFDVWDSLFIAIVGVEDCPARFIRLLYFSDQCAILTAGQVYYPYPSHYTQI